MKFGELNRRGINSWYDQRKQELDITVTGMMAGIESSAVFFLFLSGQKKDCVLNRPYPRVEIETVKKKIFLIFLIFLSLLIISRYSVCDRFLTNSLKYIIFFFIMFRFTFRHVR